MGYFVVTQACVFFSDAIAAMTQALSSVTYFQSCDILFSQDSEEKQAHLWKYVMHRVTKRLADK
jgi:hypothetical protein